MCWAGPWGPAPGGNLKDNLRVCFLTTGRTLSDPIKLPFTFTPCGDCVTRSHTHTLTAQPVQSPVGQSSGPVAVPVPVGRDTHTDSLTRVSNFKSESRTPTPPGFRYFHVRYLHNIYAHQFLPSRSFIVMRAPSTHAELEVK